MPLFFLWLLGTILSSSAPARQVYGERITGIQGTFLCCRNDYWECYRGCDAPCPTCSPDARCLQRCESALCRNQGDGKCDARGSGSFSSESAAQRTGEDRSPAEGSARAEARPAKPQGQLRPDGTLTGPGKITFEAFNRSPGPPTLQVIGLVFGKDRRTGEAAPLKQTETVSVLPSKSSRFFLEITGEEFSRWEQRYGDITVGLTFPDTPTAEAWTFENLLTEHDTLQHKAGEFRVKGAFHPRVPASSP